MLHTATTYEMSIEAAMTTASCVSAGADSPGPTLMHGEANTGWARPSSRRGPGFETDAMRGQRWEDGV